MLPPVLRGHTYVLLQLGLADVGEAEGEQRLPRSHVEHVVLLAEQQRRVVEDAVHGEPLGGSFPGIWRQRQNTNTGLLGADGG